MTRMFVLLVLCLGLTSIGAGEKAKFEPTKDEIEMTELTNNERKKKDLQPLKLNPALSKIARAHSENMARQGKMEHVLDGKNPLDRIRAGNYKFVRFAENIAYGDKEFKLPAIMKGWMESKVHSDNILTPDFTEIGLGIARNKEGTLYYTQVFAIPRQQ